LLKGRYKHRSFWINNQLHVANATEDLIIALAIRDDVQYIEQEEIYQLDVVSLDSPVVRGKPNDNNDEWGIVRIRAREAAKLMKSFKTNSVIVGTIDTGVRYTHEALRNNWVGPEYGWLDPEGRRLKPYDDQGHGTHTMGTICGSGGIGVYPQAKWMTCKGCGDFGCRQSTLLKCMEFMLCPTHANGQGKDCTKAPHVVSNSWGGSGGGKTDYDQAIRALQTGGITVLFSNGNSGSHDCGNVGNPAERFAIGVGSTTFSDRLSSFSSVGPTVDGKIKQDISAPGSDIWSAWHKSDTAYSSLSGTSMACPHAAGAAVMLYAVKSDIKPKAVDYFLKEGADTNLTFSYKSCGGIRDDVFPNNHFGRGRVNAERSVALLAKTLG